ncbi:MAG: hypothetical protein A2V66_02945 [Ignavibacteria bacterium RBG_13_36_8]|nr:MAG: hypothetical protein A2V66_02945 [Ignavibacteria bacterium RBG_13_36_8]
MTTNKSKESVLFDESTFDHLINCRDIDNLIIKGHLIIEHKIDEFIDNHSIIKTNFQNHKIGFNLKIDIAKVLGLFILSEDLFSALILLNKLRNSIAHNLKPDEELFNNFIQVVDSDSSLIKLYKEFGDVTLTNDSGEQYKVSSNHFRFSLCIANLYGRISEISNFTLKELITLKTRKFRIEKERNRKSAPKAKTKNP